MPVDYSKGQIYKIWSPSTDLTYYGSTTQPLSKRMVEHRSNAKKFDEGKRTYKMSSYHVLEAGDARILRIERFPCIDKFDLETREAFYIKNNECVNKFVPQRTKAEYYVDNKEMISEWHRTHYINNKAAIDAKHREYYANNREAESARGRLYRANNQEAERARARLYHANNRDAISVKKKQYRAENQARIKAPTNCECGGRYKHQSKSTHFKTKRHIEFFSHPMRALFAQ